MKAIASSSTTASSSLTIYMHFSHLSVKEGDKVQKGQEVGLSGATGRATGPHLHVACDGRRPTWIRHSLAAAPAEARASKRHSQLEIVVG